MYFNVNFNVFFKLIKLHFLVNELYIYQNARCNDEKIGIRCVCNRMREYQLNELYGLLQIAVSWAIFCVGFKDQ